MRGLFRVFAGLFGLAILAGILAWVFRAELAGLAVRAALARAGFENPDADVSSVTFSALSIDRLRAGRDTADPAVDIESVALSFDWRELVAARKVRRLELGPGAVRATMDAAGRIAVAGYAPSGGGGAAPFDTLVIKDIALSIEAPSGRAQGQINGAFAPALGGSLNLDLETDQLESAAITARNANFDGKILLADDGGIEITGALTGDFATPAGAVQNSEVSILGEGASWREFLAGRREDVAIAGRIDFLAGQIITRETPILAFLSSDNRESAAPIDLIGINGGVAFSWRTDELTVSALEASRLTLSADRGDVLILKSNGGAPLFSLQDTARALAVEAELTGGPFDGRATVSGADDGDGVWRITGDTAFGSYSLANVDFGDTDASFEGTLEGNTLQARIDGRSFIREARVGRLRIREAPIASIFGLGIDFDQLLLAIVAGADDCVDVARANVTLEGQDSEVTITEGAFCNDDGSLAQVHWGVSAHTDVTGRFAARSARVRIAQTRFSGTPPIIDFDADYNPRAQQTVIRGDLSGGRMLLNEALVGSESSGAFTFQLDGEVMKAEADLDALRVVQNRETLQVAPLMLAGTAMLADDAIAFDYTASTLRGRRLGDGVGRHDLASGRGESEFVADRLQFEPGGLQPAGVLLALKGIIGNASGAAGAVVNFSWGRNESDLLSSATLAFDDLSFIGPGLVFTGTRGVAGEVRLSNLRPLTTDGLQRISVKALDMDALSLESGVISFSLPGDDSILVEEAAFPWFGGVVGVYGATASLAGGEARIPLRIDNADIAKMLEFVSIDGLDGEGAMSGVLPLSIEGGKARIVDGELHSLGPGSIRYKGAVSDSAAQAGQQAELAFSILRDLQFKTLKIDINGPLDGTIDFNMFFEGTGEVPVNRKRVRVPVRYTINLDAALLELLNQARLSRNLQAQIELGLEQAGGEPETSQ